MVPASDNVPPRGKGAQLLRFRPKDGETGYWLRVGLAGWGTVAAIAFADIGLQRVLAGKPFLSSWADAIPVLAWVLPGALLSIPVVALFRRFRRQEPDSAPPWGRYALTGVGYWIGWSVSDATVIRSVFHPGSIGDASLLTAVYRALPALAFNSIVLFTVMVVLFETTVQKREARDREIHTARLRSEVSRARTAALAAKLDPHFLFNTLHVASGLMNRDPEAAREVLSDLSELIEEATRHQGPDPVRLEDELRLMERYLRILKIRFGPRLSVDVRVTPDARSCWVPPLLLQPLVENAVQHGVSGSKERCSIHVLGETERDRLLLEVVNTVAPARTPRPPATERIGLGGVRARLDLHFGRAASLHTTHLSTGEFRAAVQVPVLARPPQPVGAATGHRASHTGAHRSPP